MLYGEYNPRYWLRRGGEGRGGGHARILCGFLVQHLSFYPLLRLETVFLNIFNILQNRAKGNFEIFGCICFVKTVVKTRSLKNDSLQ